MSVGWSRPGLRVSLTLWHVAALVVVLIAYASTVYVFVGRQIGQALDERLRGDFQWAAEMSEQKADGTLAWFESSAGGDDLQSPWLQVWDAEGGLLFRSSLAGRLPIPDTFTLPGDDDRHLVSVLSPVGPYRLMSGPARIGARRVVIQVARSEEPARQERRELLIVLLLGFPFGIAVAGCGGYLLARRALMPIDRMAERAQAITAERLGDRLPVENPSDELGRLAGVFNATLGRLESSFDGMRRFTADVSHELRTPLTAIRSVGEVGLRRPRDADEYQRIIGSMLEEVERLTALVERLLDWSRAETGQAQLVREPFDLGDLAAEVAAHVGVLAEEKGQAIAVDRSGDVSCLGDRGVLRQALINLVDNAIKFTPEGGRIRVRTVGSAGALQVRVSDSGPGLVGADSHARVFDRFYQGRRTGTGAGLGLSIAKWAVEINGGAIAVEQEEGGGSTFQITLPRQVEPDAARGA